MTTIRLFIAIDMPVEIRHRLFGMGREIRGARPVPQHQSHLTLKFIGEVPESLLQPIREILATIVFPPFSLSLQGIDFLPARGQARIVWAGIKAEAALKQLAMALEESLEPLGITRDRREYFPHVTLARLKNPSSSELRQFLSDHTSFATETFAVHEFYLYSSRLTTQSAIHRIEGCYRLIG